MFRNFKYVYALYEEGNFTKAAKKLFISQPSLSVAVKNIEKEIGEPLFKRRGGGVQLTEVGKTYIAAAEKIKSIENQFKQEVNDFRSLEHGEISIGSSSFISSYVLPKIINKFTALHPKIKISLLEANSSNLLDLMDKEQVDVIIDNIESSDKYQGVPLAKEEILLCVPKKHSVNEGLSEYQITPKQIFDRTINIESVPPVSLKIFKNEKFILLKPGNDMYNRATELFGKHNMEPDIAFLVDQLNTSYALTDSGAGVSFVTNTFFKYSGFEDNIVLYKMAGQRPRTLCCSYLKNRYCPKAMTEFIRVAKEIVN